MKVVKNMKSVLMAAAMGVFVFPISAQCFEDDPFGGGGRGEYDRDSSGGLSLSSRQRFLMTLQDESGDGGNVGEEPSDSELLALVDRFRMRGFSRSDFRRSVSSIMQRKRMVADRLPGEKIYESKVPTRYKPDPDEWPKDPEKRKEFEKNIERHYQRKVANYTAEKEVAQIQEAVILGDWEKVATYLSTLKKPVAKYIYRHISSQIGAQDEVRPMAYLALAGTKTHRQQSIMMLDDILRWSDVSVDPPTSLEVVSLAGMIEAVGELPASFFEKLEKGTKYFGGKSPVNRLRAAELLLAAGKTKKALPFLISADQAIKSKDYRAVDLIAFYHNELMAVEPHAGHLEIAWGLSRWMLDQEDAPSRFSRSAMLRGFELLPKIEDRAEAARWFKDTFKAGDSHGMRLLSYVGMVASQCEGNRDDSFRFDKIQLQHATANALLNATAESTERWKDIMILYAKNWLREAAYSYANDTSSGGPAMQRDQYGNVYYVEQRAETKEKRKNIAIPALKMIRTGPTGKWMALLDEPTRLACLKNFARLYLKVKEDVIALRYIEEISKINKNESAAMISELIQVWADNHDPNAQQSYRSSWQYSHGHSAAADGIPLTRSKQQRNLKQLKALTERLKKLGLSRQDEVALARAFMRCHSKAEIWRMDSFEEIFGKTEALSPETISAVLNTMRQSLVRVWPQKKVQKQAKTKRTDVELQQEVIGGYESAIDLAERMLTKYPDNWQLALQKATLKYSFNGYLNQIGKGNNSLAKKRAALLDYKAASDLYCKSFSNSQKAYFSLEVFENWFYAALGSADIQTLRSYHQPVEAEYEKIRSAIDSFPPGLRKAHMDGFANMMALRVSAVGPDLKLRYLKAGLSIAGDNPRALEAKKLDEYYKDLVTEIEVVAEVDGSTVVDPTKPFGVIINLRHTKDIEREAGGFQKYLQNQSSSGMGNYGRPSEDYRDKFEKGARAALEESFDVESVTFHPTDVESYTDKQHGWRVTPYAYIVLKPKDAKVDTIPSLQLDFDFLDTSGYVVIPVASAKLPIDCSSEEATRRPYYNLQVTQIFDDRSINKKDDIILEIKAKGYGILPPVEELVRLDDISGFEIAKVDDRGNQIQMLDSSVIENPAFSERYIQVHLKPKDGKMPSAFTFPKVLADVTEKDGISLKRYEDVDLVVADQTIALTGSQNQNRILLWLIGGLAAVVAVGMLVLGARRRKDTEELVESAYQVPEVVTPVNALGILERLTQVESLTVDEKSELQTDMDQIVDLHFGKGESSVDFCLKGVVEKWVTRVAPAG